MVQRSKPLMRCMYFCLAIAFLSVIAALALRSMPSPRAAWVQAALDGLKVIIPGAWLASVGFSFAVRLTERR